MKNMNWISIETAPKDDKPILAWLKNSCEWEKIKYVKGKWCIWTIDGFDTLGWYPLEDYEQPIYWMPMPESPE